MIDAVLLLNRVVEYLEYFGVLINRTMSLVLVSTRSGLTH